MALRRPVLATCVAGMRASSQTYAVKPSSDPATIRYDSANPARSVMWGNECSSPVACDSASNTAPPSIICAPAASGSDFGRGMERVNTAPSDQAVPPARITTHGSPGNGWSLRSRSHATPQNPSATSASVRQRNGC